MLILTIKTDQPLAEIGLFEGEKKLDYIKWEAHRQLTETIFSKIKSVLDKNQKGFENLDALIVYEGPGSFTGLRIGIAVANAIAYSLNKPIVATTSEDWIKIGQKKITDGEISKIVFPKYGAPVHITLPVH